MRVLFPWEIRQMLAVINPRTAFGVRDRAMLVLLLHTGLRVSEVCGLAVRDVALDGHPRQAIDLPRHLGKGGHPRIIPLNGTARAAVAAILAFNRQRGFSVSADSPLLVTRQGRQLPVRTFQHLVQGYREAAGLSSRVTPHAFRHTLATELAQVTGNLRVVQLVLGHARLETVQVYVSPSPAEVAAAMDQVG